MYIVHKLLLWESWIYISVKRASLKKQPCGGQIQVKYGGNYENYVLLVACQGLRQWLTVTA